ncbi:MAG TPA: hypothetical protein VFQ79_16570 [Bryobacteraceae bacterium]|nr:hypothetical protein [Bryobacteraceae bacterium]
MDFSRRLFLGAAAAAAARSPATAKKEEVYRFRTEEADIEMAVQFHDEYTSRGFWFGERNSDRRYCLSAEGEEGRNCVTAFRGSIAIARYRVRPRSLRHDARMLREYVRTVDYDARLAHRPPFERTIVLENGLGSDLQAFGYEAGPDDRSNPETHGPWYLCRQDLYLDPQPTPFLILYWKHALPSIRLLDLIPGEQTWVVKK